MIVSRPAHDGHTTEHQSRRSLALHSTVAAVLGSGVTVLVHEATHLVAVLGLVGQGRLYPYGAQYDGELDGVSTAVVALAGPAVSLALGLTLLLTLSRARVVGPWHLVRLWCGASSYVVGAGYLFITPFGAGDTAIAVRALDLPAWTAFVAAAAGLALCLLGARLVASRALPLTDQDDRIARALLLHPAWIGTVVNLGLMLAYLLGSDAGFPLGQQVAVVSGYVVLLTLGPWSLPYLARRSPTSRTHLRLGRVPVVALLGLAVLIAVNLALLPGLRIG